MSISVRFAPSPTGLLHIGNIRAALFNYLFARRNGGNFMLRLDDTDQERSTQAFADAIARDMTWLGLEWDRFARQSERTTRYTEELNRLKATGRVYPCFETQSELDLKRKTQLGRGLPPVYDRAALKLTDEEKATRIAAGEKPHWRFRLNDQDVSWDDLVQGHKHFPAGAVSDPVIVRTDGVPLYTFCSIVDDIDFDITHIIRGEDHVTNTSTQIQIWQALTEKPVPIFAHFPLLISADGTEMSKRLGTLSISSMRDEMNLEAMAVTSLLAKLGTSDSIVPHLSMVDLIDSFALEKISHGTAKFDMEELRHLGSKLLHQMPYEMAQSRLASIGADNVTEPLWNVARANLTTIMDIKFWEHIVYAPAFEAETGWQTTKETTLTPEDKELLKTAQTLLPAEPWGQTTWKDWTKAIQQATNKTGRALYHPLRLALTHTPNGPEMKALLPLIGKEKTERRLLA